MDFKEFIGNREKINVGFLGGSITEGAGSSSNEFCYARMVCKRLGDIYKDTDFECINAGVGGTTSALGLFRMKRDLLSKKPDIVFVEFAVNDTEFSSTGIYMENIVREVKKYNKNIPVLILLTTTTTVVDKYGAMKNAPSGREHIKLAEYYGLELINIGDDMYDKALKDNIDFNSLFTDGVHPNDRGHDIYSEIIVERLKNTDFNDKDINMPLLYGRSFEKPELVMANTLADDTWKLSYNNMYARLPDYIYSFTPGDELFFEFKGSFLGLYYTIEKDSGTIEYKIDDEEWHEMSMWDKYALQFNRAAFGILSEKLEDRVHKVTIRNIKKKADKSEGFYVRIGAFAVG